MADLGLVETVLTVFAIFGVGKLLELLLGKLLNRKVDSVASQKAAAEIAKTEVETVRQVLEEVKAHSATKDARIDKLESDLTRIEDRMEQMEERERHQLTRAAVHEAWDQMAFQFILQHNPEWQPPPPLNAHVPPPDPTHHTTTTTTATTTASGPTHPLQELT